MRIFFKFACNAALILLPIVAWSGECTTVPDDEGEPRWEVYAPDKTYLGYVVQERDGTWFAWRDGKGTTDQTLRTYDEAVEWVCQKPRGADDDSDQTSPSDIASLKAPAGNATPKAPQSLMVPPAHRFPPA